MILAPWVTWEIRYHWKSAKNVNHERSFHLRVPEHCLPDQVRVWLLLSASEICLGLALVALWFWGWTTAADIAFLQWVNSWYISLCFLRSVSRFIIVNDFTVVLPNNNHLAFNHHTWQIVHDPLLQWRKPKWVASFKHSKRSWVTSF